MPVVPRNDPTLLLPARSSWAHGLVGGLVKKGLQNWVPQSLRGPWVVQDLLERRIHTLCLLDLLHRAAVITGVGGCSGLSAQDELLQRRQVGKALPHLLTCFLLLSTGKARTSVECWVAISREPRCPTDDSPRPTETTLAEGRAGSKCVVDGREYSERLKSKGVGRRHPMGSVL